MKRILYISVFIVASGPRVKLAGRKSVLIPPVVYSTDRPKAVVPALVLLCVALWFILRGDLFFLYFIFFSPFSIAITSLGEERANLDAFPAFVQFAHAWCFLFFFFFFFFVLFPLPLRVSDGLRLVIVGLPGLFSYLFLATEKKIKPGK